MSAFIALLPAKYQQKPKGKQIAEGETIITNNSDPSIDHNKFSLSKNTAESSQQTAVDDLYNISNVGYKKELDYRKYCEEYATGADKDSYDTLARKIRELAKKGEKKAQEELGTLIDTSLLPDIENKNEFIQTTGTVAVSEIDRRTVVVKGLPPQTTLHEVQAIFEAKAKGKVTITVPKGIWNIIFETEEDAKNALSLNGTQCRDRKISVIEKSIAMASMRRQSAGHKPYRK